MMLRVGTELWIWRIAHVRDDNMLGWNGIEFIVIYSLFMSPHHAFLGLILQKTRRRTKGILIEAYLG